jgi:hypothetical protein
MGGRHEAAATREVVPALRVGDGVVRAIRIARSAPRCALFVAGAAAALRAQRAVDKLSRCI